MATAQVTFVLLYFSVAGTCKRNVRPTVLVVISGVFSRDNNDPLTIQPITPVVELQWKVAVEPKIALMDVGVLTKAGYKQKHCYRIHFHTNSNEHLPARVVVTPTSRINRVTIALMKWCPIALVSTKR